MSPISYSYPKMNRRNCTQRLLLLMTKKMSIFTIIINCPIEKILFDSISSTKDNFPMMYIVVHMTIFALYNQCKTSLNIALMVKKRYNFYMTIYLIKQDWCCPNKSVVMSPSFSNKMQFLRKLFTDIFKLSSHSALKMHQSLFQYVGLFGAKLWGWSIYKNFRKYGF